MLRTTIKDLSTGKATHHETESSIRISKTIGQSIIMLDKNWEDRRRFNWELLKDTLMHTEPWSKGVIL